MKMTMATINNDDYLDLAEHPALKIAFLLSCSASHSLNPLVNGLQAVYSKPLSLYSSRDNGDGDVADEDTFPPGQEGQQTEQ